MAKVRLKRNINVQRVVYKVAATVIALWVGGEIIESVDDNINLSTFNCTGDGTTCWHNVFASGFTFLGLNGSETAGASATGILSVIGIVAAAAIILEFVEVSM